MPLNDLQATATVGGNSLSGYLVKMGRQESLTSIAGQFELELGLNMPHTLVPFDDVVLTEEGATVLTGYVDKITRERAPQSVIRVTGRNTYKRAEEFFIDDYLLATDGETAGWWVDYLCGLCGLSYVITSGLSTEPTVVGFVLGLQTVSAGLELMAQIMQCNMRVTPAGVLEFIQLPNTPADHVFNEYLEGEYETGDTLSRNVAKIWGTTAAGLPLLYQESRSVPGLNNDRIMVVSFPQIQTLTQASAITDRLLDHYAKLDQESHFSTVGDPVYEIGEVGEIEILPGTTHVDNITDLASETGAEGYRQSLVIGRKNLFLPFFPGRLGPVLPPGPGPDPTPTGADCYAATNVVIARTPNFTDPTPNWENITGAITTPLPFSLNITDFNLDPWDKKQALVSTAFGNIFHTSDITVASPIWTKVASSGSSGVPSLHSVQRVIYSDAANGEGVAYALLYRSGFGKRVLRSTNHGLTWAVGAAAPGIGPTPEPTLGNNSIAVSRASALTVYISVGYDSSDEEVCIQVSTDSGATWADYFGTPLNNSAPALDLHCSIADTLYYWRADGNLCRLTGGVELVLDDTEAGSTTISTRNRPYRVVSSVQTPSTLYRLRNIGSPTSGTFELDRSTDSGLTWSNNLFSGQISTVAGLPTTLAVWPHDQDQIVFGYKSSGEAIPASAMQIILVADVNTPTTLTSKNGDWSASIGTLNNNIVRIIQVW